MNIVVRNNISSKLKNSASEIGYYSYTNRCSQLKTETMREQFVVEYNGNVFNLELNKGDGLVWLIQIKSKTNNGETVNSTLSE